MVIQNLWELPFVLKEMGEVKDFVQRDRIRLECGLLRHGFEISTVEPRRIGCQLFKVQQKGLSGASFDIGTRADLIERDHPGGPLVETSVAWMGDANEVVDPSLLSHVENQPCKLNHRVESPLCITTPVSETANFGDFCSGCP